jgi:hypothetical protein
MGIGLVIACVDGEVARVLELLKDAGDADAVRIGSIAEAIAPSDTSARRESTHRRSDLRPRDQPAIDHRRHRGGRR